LTKEQNGGGETSDEYDPLDGRNEAGNLHRLLGREGSDGYERNG